MEDLTTAHRPAWPTTIWTDIAQAQPGPGGSLAALEQWLSQYYRPLLTHLCFKFAGHKEDAADWLQDFLQQKVLLGDLLRVASRDKGRFRTYLLNSLDRFVYSELRRLNAKKRRPAAGLVPLEAIHDEAPAHHVDPSTTEWARAIIDLTLKRMEAECREKNCLVRWRIFKVRLLDPLLDGGPVPAYEQLVRECGFSRPAEAFNALTTAKRQFARLLRDTIAEYAGSDGSEQELLDLKRSILSA